MRRVSGIYQILNAVNGKRYVGSAVNLQNRQQNHWSALKRGDHGNQHLQRAFNKHGESVFLFKIIEYASDLRSNQPLKQFLLKREQYYFGILKPEYNLLPTAGNNLGHVVSSKTRRKLSTAGLGRIPSEETRQKIGKALAGRIWCAKLTEFKVKVILLLLIEDRLSHREIVDWFEVDKKVISNIKARRTWKHIKIKNNHNIVLLNNQDTLSEDNKDE